MRAALLAFIFFLTSAAGLVATLKSNATLRETQDTLSSTVASLGKATARADTCEANLAIAKAAITQLETDTAEARQEAQEALDKAREQARTYDTKIARLRALQGPSRTDAAARCAATHELFQAELRGRLDPAQVGAQ